MLCFDNPDWVVYLHWQFLLHCLATKEATQSREDVSGIFQSHSALSHAYHCQRHQVRHCSKFKWEFNQQQIKWMSAVNRFFVLKWALRFFFLSKLTLWANSAVQCISIDQEALFLTAAMGFQHVDRVDGVLGDTPAVHKLHSHGGIHHHVCKEVRITVGQQLRSMKALSCIFSV